MAIDMLFGIIATDGDGLSMPISSNTWPSCSPAMQCCSPQEVPEDFLIHHLAGSFAETVKWWASKNMEADPENVVGYYMHIINKPVEICRK